MSQVAETFNYYPFEESDIYPRAIRFGTVRGRGFPAVILLDLKMPRLDGIGVLNEIKSDPVLKLIPVVIITSSREETDLVKSYKLGVNAYVVKPVDFTQFTEAIKQLGAFWAVFNEIPHF